MPSSLVREELLFELSSPKASCRPAAPTYPPAGQRQVGPRSAQSDRGQWDRRQQQPKERQNERFTAAIERRQMTARPANLIALELPLLELGEVACKLFVRLKNVKTNPSQHAIERRQMTDCTTGEPDRA